MSSRATQLGPTLADMQEWQYGWALPEVTSSGLDAWYTRHESSNCFSASAWSVTPLDSYTGVTLWHSAMAFTASCTRLLMVLRTLVVTVGPF